MKLVIQRPPDKAIVRKVDEYQLKDTINGIKANYYGYEQEPLDYELFRYKLDKGVAIIYKDNKVLRTKNSWYEIRGLTNLSRHFGGQYLHSVTREFKNGMQTEIDGLDVNTKEIMVELKNQVIDQKWIEFYEKKRERLGLSQCFIVSPRFEGNISYSSKIRCFQFNPDYETLMNYYNERFILPDWFRGLLR